MSTLENAEKIYSHGQVVGVISLQKMDFDESISCIKERHIEAQIKNIDISLSRGPCSHLVIMVNV